MSLNIRSALFFCSLLSVSTLSLSVASAENDRYAAVQVEAQKLSAQLYYLKGAGGNMAAVTGPQGVLLVDAQFAEMAAKIQKKLAELSSNAKISTLVNTHHHGDHVNGNKVLGQGIAIIAHQNVYQRLSTDEQFDPAGLPTVLVDQRLNLTLNGEQIELLKMPASHTDGDIVVRFITSNVLHTGDLMFADRFPFIDTKSGGSVQGYIENTKVLIASIDDQTKVIPGHGELTNKAGLAKSLAMMEQTFAKVQSYKKQGMTEAQVVKQGLGAEWASWNWNFITEERWIKTLYQAAPAS
jgi:cyclase